MDSTLRNRPRAIFGILVALLVATALPTASAAEQLGQKPPPDFEFLVAYDIDAAGNFRSLDYSSGGRCVPTHDASRAVAIAAISADTAIDTRAANYAAVHCDFDEIGGEGGRWVPLCYFTAVHVSVSGIGAAGGIASCNILTGPTAACVATTVAPCFAAAAGATVGTGYCGGFGVVVGTGYSVQCHFGITWVWVPI